MFALILLLPWAGLIVVWLIGATLSPEPAKVAAQTGPVFVIPHRWPRATLNLIGFGIGATVLATGLQTTAGTRSLLLAMWIAVSVWVEYRTLHLRIVVTDVRLAAYGSLWTRVVPRADIAHFDLDLPGYGAFTPGGGERLFAVTHNGKRIPLTFDRTRTTRKHCAHFGQLVTDLTKATAPSADPTLTEADRA